MTKIFVIFQKALVSMFTFSQNIILFAKNVVMTAFGDRNLFKKRFKTKVSLH